MLLGLSTVLLKDERCKMGQTNKSGKIEVSSSGSTGLSYLPEVLGGGVTAGSWPSGLALGHMLHVLL